MKKKLLVKFRDKNIILLFFFFLLKQHIDSYFFFNILFYNIADLGFTEDVIVVCICLYGLWANQWAGFYYF